MVHGQVGSRSIEELRSGPEGQSISISGTFDLGVHPLCGPVARRFSPFGADVRRKYFLFGSRSSE